MLTRIVSYAFLGMLFFALFLAMLGVRQVGTGEEYYRFLGTVSQRFDSWKLEIPNIPKINNINTGDYDKSGLILGVLIKIANFFVNLVNVLIGIFNILILILNIIIQLLQFITTLLFSLKDLIGRLAYLNT